MTQPTSAAATPAVTPERIFQFAWGFAPPLAIEAAVRHRLFDTLAERPLDAAGLAQATGTSPRGITAIADLLAGLGLLARDAAGRYALTPESEAFLVSSRPGFAGGLFRHVSSQLLPSWLHLTDIVASGKPPAAVNDAAVGTDFFSELVEDIFPMSYPAARQLAGTLGLTSSGPPLSVLDLAAGSGVWGIALAEASARVRVCAVDWPGVLPITRRIAERHGVADRFTLVGGDLLEADFGRGHTVATLGHILHSEGVERSRALLRRVHDALAPGGTIAIAEFLVDADRRGPPSGLIFAVNMLVCTENGGTYSFEEISNWLTEAGFTEPRLLPCPGPSPLVLATRPSGS